MNADKVEQATNIDNALRNWQVEKAKELGFKNIADLNKQTQLSKFIIDKLGDQVVGKSGLNDITLTDWIMLSGGDPTAVGGFLTKKFFSSKKVQSKIAEMLNKGEVKGQIVPKVTTSKKLPQQQSEKVLEKASTNNTTSGLKSKGTIPENSLISEAKKYKSAEEFVNEKTRNFGLPTRDVADEVYKNVYKGEKPTMFEVSKLYPTETNGTREILGAEKFTEKTAGKKIDTPIIITEKGTILDGHNRYYQALANGDKQMPVYILKDKDAYKSQLEEIWKKANKK